MDQLSFPIDLSKIVHLALPKRYIENFHGPLTLEARFTYALKK